MKIKTILNAQEFPKNYEQNNKPSMTIPDQALSIKEILNRFARGIPVEQLTPIYEDVENPDDYLPDPRKMDLAERQEFAQMVQAELDKLTVLQPAETVGLTKTETEG